MNFTETLPIQGRDRLTSVETAVSADETALGQTSTTTFCDISLTALSTPVTPVISFTGTAGSTSYSYYVMDMGNAGTVAPSATASNTLGYATLSTTNYATIVFTGIAGHTYSVVRAVGGTGQGTIYTGTIAQTSIPGSLVSVTVSDTGLTASGNQPSVNTTGAISCPGPIVTTSVVALGANVQTISATAATSLTPTHLLNSVLNVTNAATTATLPTAVAMVAALPGVKANTGFKFLIRAASGYAITLASNTGFTFYAGATQAIASLTNREYFVQFTNVTSGSEAAIVFSGPESAS
jgi:hypothetical protein